MAASQRDIVRKVLKAILQNPSHYHSLGPLPIQQKELVAYLRKNYQDLGSGSALTARVQRVANELLKNDPSVAKTFRFKSHKRSDRRKSPNPSRRSQADEIKELQNRVKKLEDFKRQFDQLLASGSPEPESPRDEAG